MRFHGALRPASQEDRRLENLGIKKSTTAFGSPASCIMISDASTWSRRPCSPSTTRSARGCHPCLRYVVLPTCPGRTRKSWSGRRDSNPRPRPWQGRALPLSYTRIRATGGDDPPATGRAMPNAALECNSPHMARNRPEDRLTAIMRKNSSETARDRPPGQHYWSSQREDRADWRFLEPRCKDGLASAAPARNYLPADCKSDFQPPIRAQAVLEQAQSASHQTRIP